MLHCTDIYKYITPDMSLATVSGCPRQTIVRQGSLAFVAQHFPSQLNSYVSKSSKDEHERLKPPERNEHVCREPHNTYAFLMENMGLQKKGAGDKGFSLYFLAEGG
jgi:hypothetical protein